MNTLGTSFGVAAADYDRGRPGYPSDVVAWIAGSAFSTVLDVGAGTGKLTATLVNQGHDVIALDPDETMLATLAEALPDVTTVQGYAESIPLPDASVDVVTFGQSWHWVDPELATQEVARVLRPGGSIGLIWNLRDESLPWVADLGRAAGMSAAESALAEGEVQVGPPFGRLEERVVQWTRPVGAEQLRALVHSRSVYITADEAEKARVDAAVSKVMATMPGLGHHGTAPMPYRTHAFRARKH